MSKHLAKKYNTLTDAEDKLNIDYITSTLHIRSTSDQVQSTPQQAAVIDDPLSPVFQSSPLLKEQNEQNLVGDVVQDFLKCFKGPMSYRLKMQVMQYLFQLTVVEFVDIDFFKFIHPDFLNICMRATRTLYQEKKHNLILELCKCFDRPDPNSPTRMPLGRMPFGLIDYNIRFFASNRTEKIGYEEHYGLWLDTMFAQFGHKWLCLHRGPAWQYEIQVEENLSNNENSGEKSHSNNKSSGEKSLLEMALEQSEVNLGDGDFSELFGTSNLSELSNGDEYSNSSLEIANYSFTDQSLSKNVGLAAENLCNTADSSTCDISYPTIEEPERSNLNLPQLWTNVKSTDQFEILLGRNVPAEMEQYHNIQPTKVKPTTRNPYMFNPLKVCKFNQFMCVCTVYCTVKCSLLCTGNGKGSFKTFYNVLSEIRLELLFLPKRIVYQQLFLFKLTTKVFPH